MVYKEIPGAAAGVVLIGNGVVYFAIDYVTPPEHALYMQPGAMGPSVAPVIRRRPVIREDHVGWFAPKRGFFRRTSEILWRSGGGRVGISLHEPAGRPASL